MRIISGSLRGRRIVLPTNFAARPTTDFAKESLFNVLNNHFDFESIEVLDLFSGTGGISFEFASRGCQHVLSVESNPKHVEFISQTTKKLNILQIRVLRQDAFKFLKFCKVKYDVIFADPPYDIQGVETIPEQVISRELLKPDGWLIVEHSSRVNLSGFPGYESTRNYGNVHFSFFMQPEPSSNFEDIGL